MDQGDVARRLRKIAGAPAADRGALFQDALGARPLLEAVENRCLPAVQSLLEQEGGDGSGQALELCASLYCQHGGAKQADPRHTPPLDLANIMAWLPAAPLDLDGLHEAAPAAQPFGFMADVVADSLTDIAACLVKHADLGPRGGALAVACKAPNPGLGKLLLAHGASPHQVFPSGITHGLRQEGESCLYVATCFQPELVQPLLDARADAYARSKAGETPLEACVRKQKAGMPGQDAAYRALVGEVRWKEARLYVWAVARSSGLLSSMPRDIHLRVLSSLRRPLPRCDSV